MYRLFLTPEWFHGWDIVFNTVGIIAAFLIAAYSWRIYRFHKENKYAYLSLAFLLIVLSLTFGALANGVLYFKPIRDTAADVLGPVVGQHLQFSHLYYRAIFFLQMASMLGAWLLVFFISQKPRDRLKKYYEVSQIALFIYLILLISVVSNFEYFVFYLTSSVLLGLIVLNYYKNYLNNNNKNTYLVMLSFLFILAGNISLIFVFLFNGVYVLGQALMLIGFLLLLYTYHNVINR